MSTNKILSVNNLSTQFVLPDGTLKAVDGVSFDVHQGQTVGIIGESGCGKSVTAQSIMRIVPKPGHISAGSIEFTKSDRNTTDLVGLEKDSKTIRSIRGGEISMIFQEPLTSLSPVHTVGDQIMEMILLHSTKDQHEAKDIAIDMLDRVGMSNPQLRFDELPHQLSGGMRQRAMIAMALSCKPSMLIADEPTTALDVTVQAQIIELLQDLQEQLGMAIMYITHDLGVICEIADVVHVMYLGKIVESASTKELFHNPLHPYTQRLLASIPKLGASGKGTKLDAIRGNVPVPLNLPPQCGFQSRCNEIIENVCDLKVPGLVDMGNEHYVRCFLHSEEEEKTYV